MHAMLWQPGPWSRRFRDDLYLNLQQDSEDGIDVCLTCFNGGCLGIERHHARTHSERTEHVFTLNVKRRPKARSSPQRVCAAFEDKSRSWRAERRTTRSPQQKWQSWPLSRSARKTSTNMPQWSSAGSAIRLEAASYRMSNRTLE